MPLFNTLLVQAVLETPAFHDRIAQRERSDQPAIG